MSLLSRREQLRRVPEWLTAPAKSRDPGQLLETSTPARWAQDLHYWVQERCRYVDR